MVHKFLLKLLQQLMWSVLAVRCCIVMLKRSQDHTLQHTSSLSSCELLQHVTEGVCIDCCAQSHKFNVGDSCIPEYRCCNFCKSDILNILTVGEVGCCFVCQ